jgi:5-bromo-4-chloroindolyl phosphate hydrolysis protein
MNWFTKLFKKEQYPLQLMVEALCDAAELWFDEPNTGKTKKEWVIDLLKKDYKTFGKELDETKASKMIDDYVEEVYGKSKN